MDSEREEEIQGQKNAYLRRIAGSLILVAAILAGGFIVFPSLLALTSRLSYPFRYFMVDTLHLMVDTILGFLAFATGLTASIAIFTKKSYNISLFTLLSTLLLGVIILAISLMPRV